VCDTGLRIKRSSCRGPRGEEVKGEGCFGVTRVSIDEGGRRVLRKSGKKTLKADSMGTQGIKGVPCGAGRGGKLRETTGHPRLHGGRSKKKKISPLVGG